MFTYSQIKKDSLKRFNKQYKKAVEKINEADVCYNKQTNHTKKLDKIK